ncbi:type IV pilus biogenesis/stability protein PilW [Shewanella marina]|uniref:type IV pilus biogenesis/stability protein PilW n=1 Tax=Shewanella marina TaxID=487319 RepID=UPI000470A1C3|nr:type IV pilus biogenesis/stability protein PilW [Shewanella marina]
MKHGLLMSLIAASLIPVLSGCVTESTYTGTDIKVAERKFNPVSAARERTQLGLTYLQRGNSEQAKFNLDKAMKYAPELGEVHIAMAYYYQTVGDIRMAEKSYVNAIEFDDMTGDAKNNFGVFLCQQGRFDQAEKMFLQAIEVPGYTQSASSYENLGLCARDAGKLDAAVEYFTIALKYDPRRRASWNELIGTTLSQQDFATARTIMNRYNRVIPQSPQSLALEIEIERGLKNASAVKRLGITLLAKYPTSPQAKQYRASMH